MIVAYTSGGQPVTSTVSDDAVVVRALGGRVESMAESEGRAASPDAYAGMALVAVLEWIEASA